MLSQKKAPIHITAEKIPEKVKLRFISSWAGFDTKAVKIEQILADFEEKNPNIEVTNESISGDDFLFTLKTDFASGNEPDVFGLWRGSDIRTFIKANKVADLFINKKAAMIVQGSWFIGENSIESNDDTVDIITFPAFEQGKALPDAIIYGLGNGIFRMCINRSMK